MSDMSLTFNSPLHGCRRLSSLPQLHEKSTNENKYKKIFEFKSKLKTKIAMITLHESVYDRNNKEKYRK